MIKLDEVKDKMDMDSIKKVKCKQFLKKNIFNCFESFLMKRKSGVALTEIFLTLHYRRRIFYYQHYIHI